MKVKSKKYDYIVECKEIEETTSVINYILNDNEDEFTYWKYVIKNGRDWNIDDKIKPKYHKLPVISFEEWQKLPDFDPKEVAFKNFVLPERWCITPVSELKEIKPKKLIGYKLVKKKYKEAVKQILKCSPTQDSDDLIGLLIHLNSDFYRKLKDAGVLDLWFEPVYEGQTIEEKISDYLASEGIGLTDEQVKNVIDIVNESKAPQM